MKDGISSADKVTSFLMIGQSNMAGRGEFGEVEPIRNKMCYMLRCGRWQTMSEPVNPDRPIFEGVYHSGVGLAASFADEYAKHTNSPIGLIPCADGGTSLSQWMPGEILYDHAVFMTKLAMRSSNFGGILWHQGEEDCYEDKIDSYKENFIAMITQLRKELGAESLPLLIGEISENIIPERRNREYVQQLNRTFHEIAGKIPCCSVVSSTGLTLKPDGLHFNSKSYREFGKRYFQCYLEQS